MVIDAMPIKALTFDVFGTVVDWRGTIIQEGQQLSRAKGLDVDWGRLADAWRAGYRPAMDRVRRGELPWTRLDVLHRMILEALLAPFGLGGLPEEEVAELNRVWHRLQPWPDARPGLRRLKKQFVIATLSNGDVAMLTHMAKHADLPWDCILSSELARHYKPDPEAYGTAASLLDLPTNEVMMVAAHEADLRAAQRVGMRTAYVPRPLEYGPSRGAESANTDGLDIVAPDFEALADCLGA